MRPSGPDEDEDELLDEVDRAIAEGHLDLADDLLSSIEDQDTDSEPPEAR